MFLDRLGISTKVAMVLALPLLLAAAIGTMGVVTIAQLDSST